MNDGANRGNPCGECSPAAATRIDAVAARAAEQRPERTLACPALFVSALASGQGKTSITAGLARLHARFGRRVRVFKTGPDFLDPKVLERASGAPVFNLDAWMVGLAESRARLYAAAQEADLILVEGAMGLYDGEPSAADLAIALGVPVAAVIDANAMAQTFGALALGLRSYRAVPFAGVIANRVAGATHARMLADSLPAGLPLLAALPCLTVKLAERHLGLVADAAPGAEAAIDAAADALARAGRTELPPAVRFAPVIQATTAPLLAGKTIAIAHDAAFAFLYPANLACLRELGARLVFFSPVTNEPVPPCDALYLPGGYPELHAPALAAAAEWRESVRALAAAGRPLLAECGGMMALAESLVTSDGTRHAMAGVLPGVVTMRPTLAAIGLQTLPLPEGALRGHTFHYSRLDTTLAPALGSQPHRYGRSEAVYRRGTITASYVHAYFPSNVAATAALFGGGAR